MFGLQSPQISSLKAIIIGSGIAGISASIRLRLKGYEVDVFEANDYPGGKLHSFELGDYRFDGGPSLFTMPHFVEELFELAGRNPSDYFRYERSPEACRYFWEDGTSLIAHADIKAFAEEVERALNFPQEKLIAHFDYLKVVYDESARTFLEKDLRSASTWLDASVVKALIRSPRYDIFKTMHEANAARLGEPHLVQLFDRFATYNGSDPYQAPGILNVIPWLEHGFGTFFPKDGMKQIPLSLHRLGTELGINYHFGEKVNRILHNGTRVQGIEINGAKHEADLVLSNMDIHFSYRELLPDIEGPARILKQERSSSALVYYWGIGKKFEALGLHNIFFSEAYREEFNGLFNDGSIIGDPTIYIHVSSKLNPQDAPENGENWFVMINAPHHADQDWEGIEQAVRKAVISKLNRILNTDIEPLIEEEKVWNPKGIETDTWSYKGALYGNSSNSQIAAFMRHPNRSSKLDGLYFCGGSVHPGGGIPLALLSAKITTEMIPRA